MDIDIGKSVAIGYVNYNGVASIRTIVPLKLHYGTNEYYKTPQWIIEAWDVGKQAARSFALANVRHATDMADRFQDEAEADIGPTSEGMKLAQELAQALVGGDETAGQVAAVNIVGNLLDVLNRLAEASEMQTRCIRDLVDYKSPIRVDNG